MRELEIATIPRYLCQRGLISRHETVEVQRMKGGVSNAVFHIRVADREPALVLKQARRRLQVDDPWFCDVERLLREVDVLQAIHELLVATPVSCLPADCPRVSVPEVFDVDRANFCYVMRAAAGDQQPWKSTLLDGRVDPQIFAAIGATLGRIHAASWHQTGIRERFGDQRFFEALRVDPYYRHVARNRREWKAPMGDLVASLALEKHCLVHGDFSPKNMLVGPSGVLVLDFEVGHYGDPAFDLGFFFSHIVLKLCRYGGALSEELLDGVERFQASYRAAGMKRTELDSTRGGCRETSADGVERRAVQHLLGCLVARVYGKSRVDYLDDTMREQVAEWLLENRDSGHITLTDVWRNVRQRWG